MLIREPLTCIREQDIEHHRDGGYSIDRHTLGFSREVWPSHLETTIGSGEPFEIVEGGRDADSVLYEQPGGIRLVVIDD